MKIHSSAKFDGKEFKFHNEIEINLDINQIAQYSPQIINLAISKFKEKCKNYLNIDFATMYFFEVYYFDKEKEINLFKKEKV